MAESLEKQWVVSKASVRGGGEFRPWKLFDGREEARAFKAASQTRDRASLYVFRVDSVTRGPKG
jgi:hypothetical protein